MKVKLVAGAEIDTLSRDELHKELRDFRRTLLGNLMRRPLVRDVPASAVTPASGVVDVEIGTPPLAEMWDVRRVVVSGSDPTANIPFTTARLYIGEAGSAFSLVDVFTAANGAFIPNVAYYGADQCPVRTGDKLTLRLTGVAAAQTIAAVAMFVQRERPPDEVAQTLAAEHTRHR